MRELDHHRQPGYLQAFREIARRAEKEKADEKKKALRAENTEHRLFALFRTASKLWKLVNVSTE